LQDYDLRKIRIPIIPIEKQNEIVEKITPIEQEIKQLKESKKDVLDIINEVFTKKLKFNINLYNKKRDNKYHTINLSNINTPLLRITFVQNSKKSLYLKGFLKDNTIYLKDIITKPIKRGKQPIYKKNGIKVIKTINIKNGEINFEQVEYVSKQFYSSNIEKAGVKKYDLLLSSTGMGRGKFALYTDDEPCFADSHISIIRFNYNYINPTFLNYYCQSFFGSEQLKYIEMQIKGTPEIYETQLNYFQIPLLKKEEQEKIVNEITKKLDEQKQIDKQIEEKQNEISELIENAIKENVDAKNDANKIEKIKKM
jgi:restriction endonuclease S subunit